MTAHQTFIFYGKLYGINEEKVKEKINELTRLLRLPSLSIQIKNLRLTKYKNNIKIKLVMGYFSCLFILIY